MDNGKVELRQENKIIRQAQVIAYLIYDNWGLPVGAGRPRPPSEAVVEGEVL
jgi:hypothetical protein